MAASTQLSTVIVKLNVIGVGRGSQSLSHMQEHFSAPTQTKVVVTMLSHPPLDHTVQAQ